MSKGRKRLTKSMNTLDNIRVLECGKILQISVGKKHTIEICVVYDGVRNTLSVRANEMENVGVE